MLSNANGKTFGVGSDAQTPVWVEIRVQAPNQNFALRPGVECLPGNLAQQRRQPAMPGQFAKLERLGGYLDRSDPGKRAP